MPIASRIGASVSSGSGTRSLSTAARQRTGSRTTGPTPSTSATSRRMATTGVMMSANITAASTLCRRTGWSVTSAVSSADRLTSKNAWRSRIARYSGSERPACRMNHTGVRSTASRRAARTSNGSTRPRLPPMAKGPLAVRWGDWTLDDPHAGTLGRARVELENAGTVTWRNGILLAYHWLDDRGNPIVWDGLRTSLPELAPGERATVDAQVRAPIPPGRYRFALDVVAEFRAW